MILTQPAMPKAAWEAVVAKMRNVYKAPVSEEEVPDIVTYLTAVKGTR
jgi:acyl-CoA thioesterase FadM